MDQQQDATTDTDVQVELLPALVEGRDPDAYVVIPVSLLSSRITTVWEATARDHRGEVRAGWFQIGLMRRLVRDGFIVDTAHARGGEVAP